MSTIRAINLAHPTSSNTNITLDVGGGVTIASNLPGLTGAVNTAPEVLTSNGVMVVRDTIRIKNIAAPGSNTWTQLSNYNDGNFVISRFNPNGSYQGNMFVGYGTGDLSFCSPIAGGVERLRVNNAGQVTMPYQPAFRAYSSAGSYSTTNTDIAFPTADFNVGNCYNTSNGRFTAPVAGVYHIIWSMSSFGAASCSLDLFVNGSSQQYNEQNNSLTYFVTGQSQLKYLNAGDYATLRLRFGTINLSFPSTNFQAFLVG